MPQVDEVENLIQQVTVNKESVDSWFWKDEEGKYTVKSGYSKIQNFPSGKNSNLYRMLWTVKVAPSAQFLAWRVIMNKVPKRINLRRRGVQLTDVSCVFCGLEEETNTHLFFTCNVIKKIWNMCNRWVEVSTTHHNQLKAHFQQFDILTLNSNGNMLWKGVWVSIIRNIWDHKE